MGRAPGQLGTFFLAKVKADVTLEVPGTIEAEGTVEGGRRLIAVVVGRGGSEPGGAAVVDLEAERYLNLFFE